MEYRIIWEIEVGAEGWVDAAKQAYGIMIDPFSEATYFDIIRLKDGEEMGVDLDTQGELHQLLPPSKKV